MNLGLSLAGMGLQNLATNMYDPVINHHGFTVVRGGQVPIPTNPDSMTIGGGLMQLEAIGEMNVNGKMVPFSQLTPGDAL